MLHRRSTMLFPAALLVLAAACGGADTEMDDAAVVVAEGDAGAAPMPMPMDTGMMATPPAAGATATDPAALLQTTIGAAEAGLTNLPAATALDVIGQWQTTLRGANQPALTEIADDLQMLQQQLQATPTNGAEIGQTLARMGGRTTAAASQAEGATADQLRRLGELLTQAGNQLSGS